MNFDLEPVARVAVIHLNIKVNNLRKYELLESYSELKLNLLKEDEKT